MILTRAKLALIESMRSLASHAYPLNLVLVLTSGSMRDDYDRFGGRETPTVLRRSALSGGGEKSWKAVEQLRHQLEVTEVPTSVLLRLPHGEQSLSNEVPFLFRVIRWWLLSLNMYSSFMVNFSSLLCCLSEVLHTGTDHCS